MLVIIITENGMAAEQGGASEKSVGYTQKTNRAAEEHTGHTKMLMPSPSGSTQSCIQIAAERSFLHHLLMPGYAE